MSTTLQAELEVQRACGNPQESGESLQTAIQLDFSLACSLSADPQVELLLFLDLLATSMLQPGSTQRFGAVLSQAS